MKKFLTSLLFIFGIFIGYELYDQTDVYAVTCDYKKYSFGFHLSEDFQGERCLDNPVRIYKIEDWGFKLRFVKMELEYQIYKFKHRNDKDD